MRVLHPGERMMKVITIKVVIWHASVTSLDETRAINEQVDSTHTCKGPTKDE